MGRWGLSQFNLLKCLLLSIINSDSSGNKFSTETFYKFNNTDAIISLSVQIHLINNFLDSSVRP